MNDEEKRIRLLAYEEHGYLMSLIEAEELLGLIRIISEIQNINIE
ncbi:MAG: hypothetical protein ACJAS4_000033 [Bacteriovoracaceae bacterium]|jgi:hypothetical protein